MRVVPRRIVLSGLVWLVAACSDSAPPAGDTGIADQSLSDVTIPDTLQPDTTPAPGLYLFGAQIITATNDQVLSGHAIIIRNGKIESIEPAGTPSAELTPVDLTGLTLLPGLIDAHVHLGTEFANNIQTRLGDLIRYGVTTVRDVGSPLERILQLRDNIAAGKLEGPRVVASGPLITSPGGHPAHTFWPGDEFLVEHATRGVTDATSARQVVDALVAAGVDHIKLVRTQCVGWLTPCTRIDDDALTAAIDQAHQHGLRATVHTDRKNNLQFAMSAGADGVEHGITNGAAIDMTLAQAIAANNLFYVPTHSVYSFIPKQTKLDQLAALRQAGAKVVVGSDSPNNGAPWGETVEKELRLMVEAGYGPLEAIRAATRDAAQHLALDSVLGTLEPGKEADIIAIEGDVTADIGAIKNVKLVLRSGNVLFSEVGQ